MKFLLTIISRFLNFVFKANFLNCNMKCRFRKWATIKRSIYNIDSQAQPRVYIRIWQKFLSEIKIWDPRYIRVTCKTKYKNITKSYDIKYWCLWKNYKLKIRVHHIKSIFKFFERWTWRTIIYMMIREALINHDYFMKFFTTTNILLFYRQHRI